MILKRKIYDELLRWKNKDGKTALLIEGARRSGKSFISREFGKREYKSFIVIDFSIENNQVKNMFKNDVKNLNEFYVKLELLFSTKLYERDSLIILDEIQLYPLARQMMKHLVADGRYDFIETGSLISLKQNTKDILIPSEEECIQLFPLDFEEYLWATGDYKSFEYIQEKYENFEKLPDDIHRLMLQKFREYMVIGGMPQVVTEFITTKNFEKLDDIKKSILKLYRNDVGKFADRNMAKVLAIFDEIPATLSKHDKQFKFASLTKDSRYREYEDSFMWLQDAFITNPCYRSTEPSIGLGISMEMASMKNYMMDTGLLITHSFYDDEFEKNEIYKALLFDKLSVNQGMIFENMVAQMLRTKGHKLFFWSKSLDSNHKYEVDFLIRKKKKIVPIEVKSSNYKRYKSLEVFEKKYGKHILSPIVIHSKNVEKKGDIRFIPIYMTMFL